MSSAIKKKEMRRNPVAEWVMEAVQYTQGHRTVMLIGAIALVVVLGSIGGYLWYRQQRSSEANLALAEAEDVLRGAPGTAATLDQGMRQLQAVAKEYPSTEGGEEALIRLGNIQYENGKMDLAEASFEQYIKQHPRGRFLMMAALGAASAREAQGDFQGAVQTLTTALDQAPRDPLAGEAYMNLGRVYEQLKRPEDARRVYGQIAEKFPGTFWAQQAALHLGSLEAK